MRKINILVSDTALLTPPTWGGPLRIYNLYNNLPKDKYDITYVGVNCRYDTKKIDKKIDKNFREILTPISKLYFIVKFLELKLIKNLTFDLYTYIGMIFDKRFKKEINNNKYDVLISSHPWSAPCIKKTNGKLFIYDSHNCEYLLMKEIFKGRKFLSLFVLPLIKMIEKNACDKSDIIITCSEEDVKTLKELYNLDDKKFYVIPNGAGIDNVKKSKKEKNIIFIGSFFVPNIEGLDFIINDLSPSLKQFNFIIVGDVCRAYTYKEIPSNVKLMGKVTKAKLQELLSKSYIAINPIFNGSGTHLKMIDFMKAGLPTVSTKIGIRGLNLQNNIDIVISKSEEFEHNILALHNNKRLYNKIRKNFQKKSIYYEWKILSEKLDNIIQNGLTKAA